MKKRIVAMLLVLAMALSLTPQMTFAATQPQTAEGSYKVGYSLVDINPYKDKENNLLVSIPMGGYQYTTERLSYEKKLDDNGDGIVDENDGIFATCVAVTDKAGTTALFFSCDLLWVFGALQTLVLDELLTDDRFAQYNLSTDTIFFNGSHNHFAPTVNSQYESETKYPKFAAAYKAFKANTVAKLVQSAKNALADNAWADMYQGTIDISDYFNENNGQRKQQLVGDKLNELRKETAQRLGQNVVTYVAERTYRSFVGESDVFFNNVRQYKITATDSKTGQEVVYYSDDGTNGGIQMATWNYKIYEYDETTGEKTAALDRVLKATKGEPATQSDDRMHLVEFRFADENKQPVVLLNWRGHLPSTASVSQDNKTGPYKDSYMSQYTSYYQISSGMVNALRYTLLQEGYRVAFLQGQGGNINMGGWYGAEGSWIRNDLYAAEKHNVYGTELAEIALYALQNNMTQVNIDGGNIVATRQNLLTDRSTYTAFQYLAGLQFQAAYQAASATGGIDGPRVYKNLYYWVDAEGTPLIDTDNKQLMTDADGNVLTDPDTDAAYADANGDTVVPAEKITGESVVIPGIFQANTYVSGYPDNGAEGDKLALCAIKIGKDFSMVTAGTELFDRYNGEDGTNMWDNLAKDHNTKNGLTMVLGYTNDPSGAYMPSKEAYTYNKELSTTIKSMAVGCYESTTTKYAIGTGEAVVEKLDIMLDFLEKEYVPATTDGLCSHCGKQVEWKDLNKEIAEGDLQFYPYLRSGHYYLSADAMLTDMETAVNANVCIDLNGKTLSVYRAIEVVSNATVSVQDSSAEGTGCVVGYEAPHYGGVFYVDETGTMNLYSGTLRYAGERYDGQGSGGILYVYGTFNMYGGLVEGTEVGYVGAAIHFTKSARAAFLGGKVTAGTDGLWEGTTQSFGNCVTSNGKVCLGGNAYVAHLFYLGDQEMAELNFVGKYTGRVKIGGMNSKENGEYKVVGTADKDGDIYTAQIRVGDDYKRMLQLQLNEEGSYNVYIKPYTQFVAKDAQTKDYTYGYYADDTDTEAVEGPLLTDVVPTLAEGSKITLLPTANVPTSLVMDVDKDMYLDLMGKSFYGAINVAEGKTLYVSDCVTDDYDITAESDTFGRTVGRIRTSTITGNVLPAPATENSNAYVKTVSGNYASFHAVDLNVDQMVLKPDSQGLYFKHQFVTNSTVAAQIESYGMAFSLTDAPTAADLAAEPTKTEIFANGQIVKAGDVIYTQLSNSTNAFGTATDTSALITGIMKETNGSPTNNRNAAMPIYGTAYIKLTTGEYILGVIRQRSLRQQVEGISQKWEQLTQEQRNGMLQMYKTAAFNRVMKTWDVANLKKAM